MSLSKDELLLLAERASRAAREAGTFIASSRPEEVHNKQRGSSPASQVVTEVDRRSEAIILEALAPTVQQFDLGILTEERPDTGARLEHEYFWCIDPLDGTLPFIEGAFGFAVSIALVSRDGIPMVGVIFDPTRTTLYSAALGLGATRNRKSWTPGSGNRHRRLSLFLDRSFVEDADYERVADALQDTASDMGLDGIETHTQAGAAINACQVLENPPACYFKFPKQNEGGGSLWDFAASACLFREAKAVATDIHGEPLELNRPDSTFMNHRGVLFATDSALARRIRALYSAGLRGS